MKRILKVFINVCCILVFGVSIVCIFGSLSGSYTDEIIFSDKCVSINGADKILVHNEKIYIGDDSKGIIQLFDMEGNYLYGIYLPNAGGSFWMGISEGKLCAYSVRTNVRYEISAEKDLISSVEQYVSFDDFCRSLSGEQSHKAKLTFLGDVEIENLTTGEKKVVILNTPIWPIPLGVCFLGLIFSVVMFMQINGLFKKFFLLS